MFNFLIFMLLFFAAKAFWNISGYSAVSKYKNNPTAALLEVGKTWLSQRASQRGVRIEPLWPCIAIQLGRKEIVDQYVVLVEHSGRTTPDSLLFAFEYLITRGNLHKELNDELRPIIF